MTRAEKKAAKSTKRDLSGFEHVERELDARAKRTKKTTDQANTGRGGRGRRGRGGAGRGAGRGGADTSTTTTSMVMRSRATASTPMELSSNNESSEAEGSEAEDSGDGFNNLPESSSDEDFSASKQGDEDTADDWIH